MTSSNSGDSFIQALNAAAFDDAARMLEPIFERQTFLTRQLAEARPFADVRDLADSVGEAILTLSDTHKMALLRAHPELSPSAPSKMTAASQREQARLSIAQPAAEVATRLGGLNDRYRTRHGFPFIVALHAASDLDSVLDRFEASVVADTEAEISRALAEVVSVATARLLRLAQSVPEEMLEQKS